MTSPMTQARQAAVDALKGVEPTITVYGSPPETVTPPAALLMPHEGEWAKQLTWEQTSVALTITFIASFTGTNAAALERLEQLAWDGRSALEKVGLCGSILAPRLVKIGAAEVAAADLTFTAHVTEEVAP